jgi:hypothetical protein
MIWTCCFFCILCRNVSLHYSRYHLKTTLRGRVFDTLMFVLNSFFVAAYKLLYQGYIIVNGIFCKCQHKNVKKFRNENVVF